MNTLFGGMFVQTVCMVHHTSVVAYAFTKHFFMSMLLSYIMLCHIILLIIGSISNKYIHKQFQKILDLFFIFHFCISYLK